MFIEFQLIF